MYSISSAQYSFHMFTVAIEEAIVGRGSYRGRLYTAILEFLKCGRGGLGSLDELELALGAIDAQGFGGHGSDCWSKIAENEALGS